MASKWNRESIPDLHGKHSIVTGANSGIGYETAYALACRGAEVILAVRDIQKGQTAALTIQHGCPDAKLWVKGLDLANLYSIHTFVESYLTRTQTLSILINNAAVMAIPLRHTADGFEMQFGTNHLGHFALTVLLLPAILADSTARVVTVSSVNHLVGKLDFQNLDGSKHYRPFRAYNQSKLANLLFAYELQRRLSDAHSRAISVACHPGYAATNLQSVGPRMTGSWIKEVFWEIMNRLMAQSAAMGALPVLYAATSNDVHGGDYIGPLSWMGLRGYPGIVRSSHHSYDRITARRLWEISENLTGVHSKPLEVLEQK